MITDSRRIASAISAVATFDDEEEAELGRNWRRDASRTAWGETPNTVHLSTKKRVLNRRWTRMDADEEGLL
jgi:hypothetical protein